MMNKRGASHADWAISLGIFLLYILSMLMIIQPGVEPFYREDQLLKIATDNFKENTAYSFYKTPLIIDTTGMDFAGEGDYNVILEEDFPFSGENVNNYALTDAFGEKLEDEYHITGGAHISQISFKVHIIDGINKFYIISNKLPDGTSVEYGAPATSPSGTEISDSDIAPHTPNFTLTIGSTEALYGVSESLLNMNVNEGGANCMLPEGEIEDNYITLKGIWNYPRSKDLSIYYVDGSSPQYEITDLHDVCIASEPYAQANVFVEEWATRIIDPVGGYAGGPPKPIRMGVKVW